MSRPTLSELIGLRKDLEEKLSGQDGHQWKEALKRFLRKENPWNFLLAALGDSVPIAATDEFTITEEFLKEKFNIRWFGDNFKKLFFGKSCQSALAGKMGIHTLQKNSPFKPIHDELGESAIVALGQIFWLIGQQSKGKTGALLVNGYANFGFVQVQNEEGQMEVCAVDFSFDSDRGYWGINAHLLGHQHDWHAGHQFLSSNCGK